MYWIISDGFQTIYYSEDKRTGTNGTEEDVVARVHPRWKSAIPLKKRNKGGTTYNPLSAFQLIVGSAFMPPCAHFPRLTIRTYLWIYTYVASCVEPYACRSYAATLNHVQARISYRRKMHQSACSRRKKKKKKNTKEEFLWKLRNIKVARPTL